MLTNDVISSEQPGAGVYLSYMLLVSFKGTITSKSYCNPGHVGNLHLSRDCETKEK